jgi:hypothetical protein
MARKPKADAVVVNSDPFTPKFISESARDLRNRGTSTFQSPLSGLSGEIENINKGVSPFSRDNSGTLSAQQAIVLCQKAYWNVAIFRNTIDIQTEFANSKLSFRGKNKRSIKFFNEWYKKINGWSLSERFFREWFRSGNVFIYKFLYNITNIEVNKMSRAEVAKKIPLRYTILNPADMRAEGSATFVNFNYYKMLNSYELARLKVPKTEDEKRFMDSLPVKIRDEIKRGQLPEIPIDTEYLTAVFCGKQDYEALSVPMYYPVLFDIDLKLEFKKMEKVIARTADYMILLITAGDKDRDANTNSRILSALQDLFEMESVGRVLVSDYSTKAEFVLPDLNKILGPEKYQVVNQDIANGLMNIFWGDEKYANSMIKIKVFLERLSSARQAFLNNFLIPEMEMIASELGFTEIPEPVFDEVDLKEEIEYMKVYTRLAEIGMLTPEELFQSFETHSLPLSENSIEAQNKFKELKDKGLYEPIIGGQKKDGLGQPAGRPAGTKAPQTTKKVSPIGASKFSLQKISDNIKLVNDLSEAVESKYRELNKIKRLSSKQKDLCWSVTESIISSKNSNEWQESIATFIENPIVSPDEKTLNIAAEHNISLFLAGLLKQSEI